MYVRANNKRYTLLWENLRSLSYFGDTNIQAPPRTPFKCWPGSSGWYQYTANRRAAQDSHITNRRIYYHIWNTWKSAGSRRSQNGSKFHQCRTKGINRYKRRTAHGDLSRGAEWGWIPRHWVVDTTWWSAYSTGIHARARTLARTRPVICQGRN